MPSSVQIQVFEKLDDYRRWRCQLPAGERETQALGFVPTMGALHEGHATLIRHARKTCRKVVVSIFVNPLQFGPNEDFSRYPRTFEQDLNLCRELGVDVVLHPPVDEIYPVPLSEMTRVAPPEQLIQRLCGLFRPGHFEGVATVVLKLFNIVQPSVAYFGEKDYQQLAVVRRMVRDLNLDVQIEGVPTVRESDGLALSSRNVYLDEQQRRLAPVLHKTITAVLNDSLTGQRSLGKCLDTGRRELGSLAGVELQYLEACDADSLEPLTQARLPMVVLVAAKFGAVRLIDNVVRRN